MFMAILCYLMMFQQSHDVLAGAIDTLAFESIEAFEITAGEGNNIINLGYDNFSDDTVYAGAGDDEITTGKGFDVIDGGLGSDVLVLNFNSSSSGIISTLINAHSGEYSNHDDTLSVNFNRIEAVSTVGSTHDNVLSGLKGNDTIYGGLGADTLLGKAGDDILDGAEGPDFIHGGNGDDIIEGKNQNDRLVGGYGNDTILMAVSVTSQFLQSGLSLQILVRLILLASSDWIASSRDKGK